MKDTTLLAGIIISSILTGIGIGTTTTLLLTANPEPEIIVNETVNENTEVINNTRVIRNTEYRDRYINHTTTKYIERYDNIQAAHTDVDHELDGDTLKVYNIDACGGLYGSSMQPTIYNENTVCSTEYTGQNLNEGMIIRYHEGNKAYEIHRIYGDYSKEGYVQTKGDNRDKIKKVPLDNITHISKAVIYTENENQP